MSEYKHGYLHAGVFGTFLAKRDTGETYKPWQEQDSPDELCHIMSSCGFN